MKKLHFIIFFIAVIILGFVVLKIFAKEKPRPLFSGNLDGKTISLIENKPLPEYEKEKILNNSKEYEEFRDNCREQGGNVILNNTQLECYEIANDKESTCTNDLDCQYDCDFSQAISSKACILTKTDKDIAQRTYTYEYECNEGVSGKCSSVPMFNTKYSLEDKNLIETGTKEFPQEESEFTPV